MAIINKIMIRQTFQKNIGKRNEKWINSFLS